MSAAGDLRRRFQAIQAIQRKKRAEDTAELAARLANYASERVRYYRFKAMVQKALGLPRDGSLRWWIAASYVFDHGKPELKAQMMSDNPQVVQRVIDAVLKDGGLECQGGYWLEVCE